MAKVAVVVGMCGGMLTRSDSKRGVGSMVAVGMSGNGGWRWTAVGGIRWQQVALHCRRSE